MPSFTFLLRFARVVPLTTPLSIFCPLVYFNDQGDVIYVPLVHHRFGVILFKFHSHLSSHQDMNTPAISSVSSRPIARQSQIYPLTEKYAKESETGCDDFNREKSVIEFTQLAKNYQIVTGAKFESSVDDKYLFIYLQQSLTERSGGGLLPAVEGHSLGIMYRVQEFNDTLNAKKKVYKCQQTFSHVYNLQ